MVELPTRPLSNIIPNAQEKVLPKPKWHFGIRSRSPPMEVMLEIYKSLGSLGMEWKKKSDISWPEIGVVPEGGYGKEVEEVLDNFKDNHGAEYQMGQRRRPDKKVEQAEEKVAQALFIVETRHRYGNVMVRMALVFLADCRYEWISNFIEWMQTISWWISKILDITTPTLGKCRFQKLVHHRVSRATIV
jgi:hypothetical protein